MDSYSCQKQAEAAVGIATGGGEVCYKCGYANFGAMKFSLMSTHRG